MLRQALTNLVDNAIKYSPERTTIVIESDVDGDTVVASVSDAGPGVDVSLRPRLFTRFARGGGRGDAHGHGLGLAIAKAAADVHHGTLTWESRPGGGSVFRLAVPRGVDQSSVEPPTVAARAGRQHHAPAV